MDPERMYIVEVLEFLRARSDEEHLFWGVGCNTPYWLRGTPGACEALQRDGSWSWTVLVAERWLYLESRPRGNAEVPNNSDTSRHDGIDILEVIESVLPPKKDQFMPLTFDKPFAPESCTSNLWDGDLDLVKFPALLRIVVLHRPDAHPIWSTYALFIVHLRGEVNDEAPHLEFPDSSHELMCVALDPSKPVKISPIEIHPLIPPNIIHQFRGLTDEQALLVFSSFVRQLADRSMSPDTDFRRAQLALLNRLSDSVR